MTDYLGIQIPQPGQSLQRMRRAYRRYTDQHGRIFAAWADMQNNAPIEELRPVSFNPPWLPSMRYAKFAQTGDLDFRWDYDTLAQDWSGQVASYYEEAGKLALQIPGDVPFPEIGDVVDRRIRLILGAGSLSPAIPLACKAGDPWILGRAGATDVLKLKPILEQQFGANGQEALLAIQARLDRMAEGSGVVPVPTTPERLIEHERVKSITDLDAASMPVLTYAAFMADAKQRGMGYAEAALGWKAHKENLAAEEIAA